MKVRCVKANEETRRKTRIAVYCRVSTKRTVQEDSLEIQKEAYQKRIELRSDWELVGIYADSLSGLSAEKRPDFMRLIEDCKAGKIDRILCKSVSRFSRNVTECQRFVELLRSMNIVVEFEKENIRTNDPTSNLLFSLMCSIAQDESRSISENIRMGYQARYKRGEYNLGNNRILGYDCVCGKLVPNQDAWIVRTVFDLFLEEKTYKEIAESLEKAGAESQRKCGHFSGTIISYILRNETYVGDKRLHKNPPRDFITKKALKDTDFESIYLTNDHEPIVDRKTWDAVQTILNQREELKKKGVDVRGKNSHFLFGKVKCGECGEYCTRRTFQERRKDENGKPMTYKAWICKEKRKGKKGNGCQNRGIREGVLLQEIAAQLSWDSFDEKRFEEVVECVIVGQEKIIVAKNNTFYYCDEHFSYIQSDIEKRIFGIMLDRLDKNEQLIFTTHNTDMLDLNLPKHSYAFLRKKLEDGEYRVSAVYASDILKRNTDSIRNAVENDVFASLPDDSLLDELEKSML